MKKFSSFLLIISGFLMLFHLQAQILPPRNLHVNPQTLTATWDAPRNILLNQKFEIGTFPPNGWQRRSDNATGWFSSSGASSQYLIIPPHSQYAVVNDDAGGPGIVGCCDYLITPSVNLSVSPGFKIGFDSYFNGNNQQKATLEMSTDNGTTWSAVKPMEHFPTWQHIEVDLSQWSGSSGLQAVMFAFHADDQGQQASGWAIDNVEIWSDELNCMGYTLSLNQNPIAITTQTAHQINPATVSYQQACALCVKAHYQSGTSANTCYAFTSTYLYPPLNLQAFASSTGVQFTWQPPLISNTLTAYHIYDSDGLLLASLNTNQLSYFFPNDFGETCIGVSAVHNLTSFGFPGQTAESQRMDACGFVDTGLDMPFTEDFSSGSFASNKWIAGPDWSITGQAGNPSTSVIFAGGTTSGAYSSSLTSWHFNSLGFGPCDGINVDLSLNFDLKLDDLSSSGTEKLIVEFVMGNEIFQLNEYANSGSLEWHSECIHIKQRLKNNSYQIRFRAAGQYIPHKDECYQSPRH